MSSRLVSGNSHAQVSYVSQEAAGTLVDRVFFVAPYDLIVTNVSETHSAAGSDGSAVTLQIEKLNSAVAPGSGTVMLGNNSNAGFDLKGAANTPQHATFKAGVSRKMTKGQRLATKKAGTLTAVAGVVVTVTYNRV